jgi:hypothetical protein
MAITTSLTEGEKRAQYAGNDGSYSGGMREGQVRSACKCSGMAGSRAIAIIFEKLFVLECESVEGKKTVYHLIARMEGSTMATAFIYRVSLVLHLGKSVQ